jgi:hypothetical protein
MDALDAPESARLAFESSGVYSFMSIRSDPGKPGPATEQEKLRCRERNNARCAGRKSRKHILPRSSRLVCWAGFFVLKIGS